MKTLLFLLPFLALASAQAAEHPSELAPVAPLVGQAWLADVPQPKDAAALQLEAKFDWAENGQAIRFTSAWVRGGKKSPYTSGFYAWNAAKKQIVIFYTDAQGSLTEGSATVENGALVHELSVAEKEGTMTPVQTRLAFKPGGEAWTNEIFIKKDGAWTPFVAVTYARPKS